MLRLLVVFFILFSTQCFAQVTDSTTFVIPTQKNIFEELQSYEFNGGKVEIQGDIESVDLVNIHSNINKNLKTISGFRIQIFSGNAYNNPLSKMEGMRDQIQEIFPDIPIYLNYINPDFKIRAGNFRNKLEAYPTLNQIRKSYPSSYIVKTDIPVNDLLKLYMPEVILDSLGNDNPIFPSEELYNEFNRQ